MLRVGLIAYTLTRRRRKVSSVGTRDLSAEAVIPFAYDRLTIPAGTAGTMATVKEIVRLIKSGTQNERVRLIATKAVSRVPWKNRYAEAQAIFDWIKANVRFTYDPEGAELVQDVDAILNFRSADCDDLVILGASLLRSIGIPVRIVIIGADPTAPSLYSHIYLQANVGVAGGTEWIGFDPSVVGSKLGWEPPRFSVKKVVEIVDN